MADGRLNFCKPCKKTEATNHRTLNIEKVRAYDRKRAQEPKSKEGRRDYAERKKLDPEFTARQAVFRKAWQERNKVKRAAHTILGNAVKDNRVSKPDNCDWCGATGKIHGHHENYDRPLEVSWLCPSCHGQRHREINEERRKAEQF